MAGSKGLLPLTGDLGSTSGLYHFEYILRMGRANLCGWATWGDQITLAYNVPSATSRYRQALWGRHAGAPLMKYPKVTVVKFDCGERGRLAPCGAIFTDLALSGMSMSTAFERRAY